MKKALLLLKMAVVCISVSLVAASCSDDEKNEYQGDNELFISSSTTTSIVDEEGASLLLNITLTKSLSKDVTLTFALANNTVNSTEIVSLSTNSVTIQAGSKTASLNINARNTGLLSADKNVEVNLASTTDTDIKLKAAFIVTVKPRPGDIQLTEQQLALIAGYKTQGLDLMSWIGTVPVTVKVSRPGDGYYEPFLQPDVRTFSGTTQITLSENATANKPVLKMVNNAMGLENYLYDILRAVTVLNTEFWCEQPIPQKTMELTGLSATSSETFSLALDDIELDITSKTISFVSDEVLELFGDLYTAVDFTYSYSAWDRLKALIDQGNQDAIEAQESGGTLYPGYLLNIRDINEYPDSDYWIPTSGSFDTSTGKMTFKFVMEHMDASDYMTIEVTYSAIR